LYAQKIFGSALRYGHALVSANRIWAVTFPISYRAAQTNRSANGLIVGMWVYIHVLSLPVFLRGRMDKIGLQDQSCHTDDSDLFGSAVAVKLIEFELPWLFIILSYPFILYRLRRKRWKQIVKVTPAQEIPLHATAGRVTKVTRML